MPTRPLLWVHPLIKSIILFGFAAYIVTLTKSDAILYYIAPRLIFSVKLAALGLYAVGAYQLYETYRQVRGQQPACECGDDGHDHTPSRSIIVNVLFYGLFAFPLLIGFLMPDTSLGTTAAAKKGLNLSSASTMVLPSNAVTAPYANLAAKLAQHPLIQVPEDLYVETLTALDLYVDSFQGKPIQLTGFVYRDESMGENQFAIGRFALQCCSADATPYGLLVQADKANLYPTDQWIQLTGTIGKTTRQGQELMQLTATKIKRIDAPRELYVSPNYDFGQ